MNNAWLEIPLSDYEAHMALPSVGQAQLLADLFRRAIDQDSPRSVAMLGCAGGNGFEGVPGTTVERVVGIDINPQYIQCAKLRFEDRLAGLQLFVGDVQTATFAFEPVELVFAGLLFEYVDIGLTLTRIRSMLRPNGTLVAVLQLSSTIQTVTPSPYVTLSGLSSQMRLVPPDRLQAASEERGYRFVRGERASAAGGKQFEVQQFRLE